MSASSSPESGRLDESVTRSLPLGSTVYATSDESSESEEEESDSTSTDESSADETTSEEGSSAEASLNEDHSYDFCEEPPRDIYCPVKLDVMLRPCQTRCCGNHLSFSAARRLKRMRKRCPLCKKTPLRYVEDKYFKRVVLGKKVYCSRKNLGCEWTGEIRELGRHSSEESGPGERCGFAKVSCRFNCGLSLLRRDMAGHERDHCFKRPFTCLYCSHEGTYETVTEKHWPKCQKYPLLCPNRCSDGSIERRRLKRHLNQDCPEEEIKCEFSHAGCQARMKRCRLSHHMDESVQQHLRSLAQYTLQLHTHASAYLAHSWEITFSSFRWHRNSNREWYSPPFYTSVGGYKMCLGVDANGFKPNRSTHLGVALYMMKGEFDDTLQWPFKGTIDFDLVDHSSARKNYTFTLVEDTSYTEKDYDDIFSRVTEGERSEEGWGFSQLISHKHLFKGKRGRVYLNNDNLTFRVTSIRTTTSCTT